MSLKTNVITLAANNDIVELRAHDKLFWTTRQRFEEVAMVSSMIESVIAKGASLTTLRHIFDEPTTTEDIQKRYNAWLSKEKTSPRKRAGRKTTRASTTPQ